MKRLTLVLLLVIAAYMHSLAQHQDVPSKPNMWKSVPKDSIKESDQLINYFKAGHMQGHFRYYFMATDNAEGLTDYFANAGGGGLRFESAPFHGIQFGVSGFYFFNILSSDLTVRDPKTNMANRYELGLFDVENPGNKKDMDRLEELFVKYSYKESHVTFGRQLINTPFINLQDGRMRPTGVEGLYLDIAASKRLKLEGGYLYAISPRGTTKWFYIGSSIGVYPSGVNALGEPSNHHNNLKSDGLYMMGAHYQLTKGIKLHAWDLRVDNIFNSFLLQSDFKHKLASGSTIIGGLQMVRQSAVGNGGNDNPLQAYKMPGTQAMTFGGQLGLQHGNGTTTLAYNRITKEGRYLMPREWGRDPFFTFMPRERNEGYGDLHAIVGKYAHNFPNKRIKASAAFGYFKLPDVHNYALNKYGMASYSQLNIDVRYSFEGFFKGVDAQLLYVSKYSVGDTYDNPRYIFNKVNMDLYHLVLNYHF